MKTAHLVAVALIAGAAGCSHESTQAPVRTQAQVENASMGCPVSQPVRIDAAVSDTPQSVSITFMGPPRSVDRLRANVHAMQDANSSDGTPFAVCPCASEAAMSSANPAPDTEASDEARTGVTNGWTQGSEPYSYGVTSMQGTGFVRSSSAVDDTPTGATLTLTPKDQSQLEMLRDQVRAEVRAMQTACVNPR
jgi:hypothetical protein